MRPEEMQESTLEDLSSASTEETPPLISGEKEAKKIVAFRLVHLFCSSDVASKKWEFWH